MNKVALIAGAWLLACAATLIVQKAGSAEPNGNGGSAQVEHGKYLVERVATCGDCHTPFDEHGQPVMDKYLQGAQLMFKPTVPVPGWVERSANIAGLKGWSDAEAMKFFTTGIDPNGKQAAPPMPAIRFNQEDAAAVVAYLRSLAPQAKQNAQK